MAQNFLAAWELKTGPLKTAHGVNIIKLFWPKYIKIDVSH